MNKIKFRHAVPRVYILVVVPKLLDRRHILLVKLVDGFLGWMWVWMGAVNGSSNCACRV